MAFGVNRMELKEWQQEVENGRIAFLTHYWIDERFPDCDTVTKAGCRDLEKLMAWGRKYRLNPAWIHRDERYPHFDLFGEIQRRVLEQEGKWDQIKRFEL
ncbi:hypothetical protein GCM10008983_22770 [Lentibacillus halophilus]|uniref:YneQ n=1 Tax=Lentibacillus halophilus TaxID=295065 RepID=A0ABN0ZEP8_9BACI